MFFVRKRILLSKNTFTKKTNFGYIYFDETIKEPYKKAYQWIQYLIKNYKKMEITPKPTHDELYPNMNYNKVTGKMKKYHRKSNKKKLHLYGIYHTMKDVDS